MNKFLFYCIFEKCTVDKVLMYWCTRFLICRKWIKALQAEEAKKVPYLGKGTLFHNYESTEGEDFLSNRLLRYLLFINRDGQSFVHIGEEDKRFLIRRRRTRFLVCGRRIKVPYLGVEVKRFLIWDIVQGSLSGARERRIKVPYSGVRIKGSLSGGGK